MSSVYPRIGDGASEMGSTDRIVIVKTGDGSPSIEMQQGEAPQEWMHHSLGALSETNYLYRPIIELAIQSLREKSRILSVGLGLGYNEFFTAAVCQSYQLNQVTLWSFEQNQFLRESFIDFIQDPSKREGPRALQDLRQAHQDVLKRVALLFQQSEEEICTFLRHLYERGLWMVESQFDLQQPPASLTDITGILYDPFSKKVNQDLWREHDLLEFIIRCSGDPCFFGSYAANGALKRALRAGGFHLATRRGFSNKRDCTLGFRPLDLASSVQDLIYS